MSVVNAFLDYILIGLLRFYLVSTSLDSVLCEVSQYLLQNAYDLEK